jgi:hypothetical protein
MKPARRRVLWTIGGACALAAAAFAVLRAADRLREPASSIASEELRDAVASPVPVAARLALGKPAPVSYFAGPSARHAEIEKVLMSRRRAAVRRRSAQ